MSSELESLLWLFKVAGVSLAGGVVGSISGLGGGIVIVPALTLFLGMPIQDAIGASIVSVIAVSSGAGSVYVKDRITNIRIAMFLELSTAAGALVGAGLLSTLVNPQLLSIIFGAVLLVSVVPVLAKIGEELPQGIQNDKLANLLHLNGSYFDTRLNKRVVYNVTGIPPAMGLMALAGIISGLLGIGAGVVKVLAQSMICMKVPTKVSTATSNFMIGVTAATAAGVYLRRGVVLPFLVVPVAVAALTGAFLGTLLMQRMSNARIRQVFVIAMAIIGLEMILRARVFGSETIYSQAAYVEPTEQRIASAKPHGGIAIEDASAWILRGGVVVSVLVMLTGMIFSFIHRHVPVQRMQHERFDSHLSAIWTGVCHGQGKAIIEVGIYLLVLTPIMRVLTSMVLFAVQEHDWTYVVITFAVLALTLCGFVLLK